MQLYIRLIVTPQHLSKPVVLCCKQVVIVPSTAVQSWHELIAGVDQFDIQFLVLLLLHLCHVAMSPLCINHVSMSRSYSSYVSMAADRLMAVVAGAG